MKRIFTRLALELNFGFTKSTLEEVVVKSFRFASLVVVTLVIYFFFRSSAANYLLDSDRSWLFDYIKIVYDKGAFEILFNAFLFITGITTIARIFRPIRFSFKDNLIFIVLWILFAFELFYWKEFDFYSSTTFDIPYPWFLLLIPVVEVLLRLIYLFRTGLPELNSSLFIENAPIRTNQEDVTTRKTVVDLLAKEIQKSRFTQAYSIGITGDWGIGKTSFINCLESSIPDAIVIRFSPWLSLGKTSLLQGFFDQLREQFSHIDKNLASDIDRYTKSLIKVENSIKTTSIDFLQEILSLGSKSMTAEFDEIDRTISRINKRIIIIIDDIDRLDTTEIVEVLKLIRNTANFSNVIYISCYDKVYLFHALQHFNKRNLTSMLDKFFDLEIQLAPFDDEILFNRISVLFFEPNNLLGDNEEVIFLKDFLLSNQILLQFREVNRFISSLSINYRIYGNRLNLRDFFLFELLKVKYPFLSSLLWSKRNDFFTKEGNPPLVIINGTEDSNEIGDYLDEVSKNQFTTLFLSPGDSTIIKLIIRELFERTNVKSMCIRDVEAFNLYFYSEIPDSSIVNVYDSIINGTYSGLPFFHLPFDEKKATSVYQMLGDNQYFLTNFSERPEQLFGLLVFLVNWSDGQLPLSAFSEAYKLYQLKSPTESHFSSLFESPVSNSTQALGRMKFLERVIQTIQGGQSEITFTTPDQILAVNYQLFDQFCNLSTSFGRGFEALHTQFDHIDNVTGTELLQKSLQRFGKFIKKFPMDFLDQNIRSVTSTNHELLFTFEPYTFDLFKTKHFEEFVNNSDYPPRRKEKIIEYFKKLKNENGRQVFYLNSSDLTTLPVEFINAWKNIPESRTNTVAKKVESSFDYVFENQPPPKNLPERNDHFYPEIFSLTCDAFIVEFEVGESEFLRIGLSFLEEFKMPILETGRHASNQGKFDVCVTIGEQDSNNIWVSPNKLNLVEQPLGYHMANSTFDRFDTLKSGDKVSFMLSPIDLKKELWGVYISVNGQTRGQKTFNLTTYQYFILSAWCDSIAFKVSAKNKLIQPFPKLKKG